MSVDSGPALVEKINKVLPITPSASWNLYGIEKDVSIWQCHDANLTAEGAVHACCTVVRSSVESVLRTLVDHNQRVHWDCTISSVKTVAMSTGPCLAQHAGRNDVVALTPKVWPRWSLLRSADASISMARWWQCHKSNRWAWMLWKSLDENVTDTPWAYTLVSSYSSPDQCAIIMVVGSSGPSIPQPAPAQQLLVGLSQYVTVLQVSQHIVIPSSEFRLEKSDDDDDGEGANGIARSKASDIPSGLASRGERQMAVSPTGLPSAAGDEQTQDSDIDGDSSVAQQNKYTSVLSAAFDSVERGVTGGSTDGWELVGTKGNVEVLKRTVGLSICCMRCTTVIHAPPEIILDCIEDNTKLLAWDEMMQDSRTVDYISESAWVEHWTHKPVWPATSRDFCVVAGHTIREDRAWVTAARSVVHPACPAHPDHVRGNVFESGAVIQPLDREIESCSVSYIVNFDFKGNVSAVVAHRISQSLPACMASLAQLCVDTHKQVQENNLKQRQSAAELAATALISPKGSRKTSKVDGPIAYTQPYMDGIDDNGDEDAEDQDDERFLASAISNQTLEYPMVGHARVDYKTLGNQAAAGLLAELLLASDIDVYQPRTAAGSGGWQFDGIEKDIVILRKVIPQSTHNLFMGKGIIPLPLSKVWAALREPHTRFGYDSMLKEMKTIAAYGDRLIVMYMLLEARQCLLAQARDFCFLHHERIEGKKYIIAAQSVEHPQCPVSADVLRGQIMSSGWCVEAVDQDGNDYSMVTYCGRVDLKGHVPTRLANYICRRQTLAINALSKYLLSSS